MKKLILAFALCFTATAYSQRNKPVDRLSEKLIGNFEKEDTGSNLLRNVVLSMVSTFDIPSEHFVDAWKEQEKMYPGMAMGKMMHRLTDTAYKRLIAYIYNKTDKENAIYDKVLQMYQSGMCPCITSKFIGKEPWMNYGRVINKCEDSLINDKSYWPKFNELTRKIVPSERGRLGDLMQLYIFLRCAPLKDAAFNYANQMITDRHYELVHALGEYVFRWPAYYYDHKQMDSLNRVFPSYKKFEADLKNAVKMDTMAYIISEGPVPYSGKAGTKLLTFYSLGWGTIIIQGQLLCTYSRTLPIVVTGYTFTPGDKVKDIASLKKKIEADNIEQLFRIPLEDDDF
jgi:hypothetical protein